MSDARDLLREAAHAIRVDVSATDRWSDDDAPFARAVANLLTAVSWFPSTADPTDVEAALAVARAYLHIPDTIAPAPTPDDAEGKG